MAVVTREQKQAPTRGRTPEREFTDPGEREDIETHAQVQPRVVTDPGEREEIETRGPPTPAPVIPKDTAQYNRLVNALNKAGKKLDAESEGVNLAGVVVDRYNDKVRALEVEAAALEARQARVDPTNRRHVINYNAEVDAFNSKLADLDQAEVNKSIRIISTHNKKVETLNTHIDRLKEPSLISILDWSADTQAQGHNFSKRVAQVLVDRPHLTQLEAERIVYAEFKDKGIPLKTDPSKLNRGELAVKHYESLTPAEKRKRKIAWKKLPVELAELTVPGVYVANNWSTLETKDKVINIAIDVAAVGLGLGLFKLAGAGARQLGGVNKATRLAKVAGKAGRELDEARAAYSKLQRVRTPKVVNKARLKLEVQHANRVARAELKSVQADQSFLNYLEKVSSISPKALRQLEKHSKLKGIKKAIQDVTKAQKNLEKAWKELDKTKLYTTVKTKRVQALKTEKIKLPGQQITISRHTRFNKSQMAANNRHIRALQRLRAAQAKLDAALAKAGSTLEPRYRPSPPAAEFKGYGVSWGPGEAGPKVSGRNPTTVDAIENWLARSREVKPTGKEPWVVQPKTKTATATAVKPKPSPAKGKHRLKLKPIYKRAKVKPKPKPKTPAVESKFGMKRKVEAARKVTEKTIGIEALGRMTEGQMARYYGTDEGVDAVAKTIQEHIAEFERAGKIKPVPADKAHEIAKEVTGAYISAKKAGKTGTALNDALEAAINRAVDKYVTPAAEVRPTPVPHPAPGPAPKKEPAADTLKSTIFEVLKPPRPKGPLRIPVPFPGSGANEKKKRERVKKNRGAVAFKMGALRRKGGKLDDVWHTWLYPYRSKTDHVVVVGRKPEGAHITRGPQSAYDTAQRLYGLAPTRSFLDKIGFQNVTISGGNGKLKLTFTPQLPSSGKVFPLRR